MTAVILPKHSQPVIKDREDENFAIVSTNGQKLQRDTNRVLDHVYVSCRRGLAKDNKFVEIDTSRAFTSLINALWSAASQRKS